MDTIMLRYKILCLFALVAFGAVFIYARVVEPHWLRIKKTEIDFAYSKSDKINIKIAHITDFHFSPEVSLEYLTKSFQQVADEHPDLICMTGDYITGLLK